MGQEYKIFAGVLGEGKLYVGTEYFTDEETALDDAYLKATDAYAKYTDRTIEVIMVDDEVTRDVAEEIYDEEMDDNIEYFVVPVDDEDEDGDYIEEEKSDDLEDEVDED